MSTTCSSPNCNRSVYEACSSCGVGYCVLHLWTDRSISRVIEICFTCRDNPSVFGSCQISETAFEKVLESIKGGFPEHAIISVAGTNHPLEIPAASHTVSGSFGIAKAELDRLIMYLRTGGSYRSSDVGQ